METQATGTRTRTGPRELARLLSLKEYRGAHGQVSYHGCHRASIQLFRAGELILDRGYRSVEWGAGPLIVE
jgi:hypothetical protein